MYACFKILKVSVKKFPVITRVLMVRTNDINKRTVLGCSIFIIYVLGKIKIVWGITSWYILNSCTYKLRNIVTLKTTYNLVYYAFLNICTKKNLL